MTTTISVPAGMLRLMLTAVLPHAGEDDTLPALNSVHFEMRAGTLYLAATDRYSIAIAREPVPGAVASEIPDQSALLPVDAARELRRLLKKQSGVAAILMEDGKLSVDCGPAGMRWATLAKGTFPDWRKLVHSALTGTQAPLGDRFGLRPELLARLTVLEGRSDPLSVRLLVSEKEAAKEIPFPMMVATMGDWFLAAVMPVKLGDGAEARWAEWTAVAAPADEAESAEAGEPDAEVPGD